MNQKYNSETVTVLLQDTTKKVENLDNKIGSITEKVDKKIGDFESKVDVKFQTLNIKFESYADKVDELINKLNDRISLNEVKLHESDKRIQHLDTIAKYKFENLDGLQNKFENHSKTLSNLNNDFVVKINNEELQRKNNADKLTKVKIIVSVISGIGGVIAILSAFKVLF